VPAQENEAGSGPKRAGRTASIVIVVGLPILVAAAVVAVIMAVSSPRPSSQSAAGQPGLSPAAARDPGVDPGTSLPGIPAPGFTLTSQSGAHVSLRQFRGKVVVLAFVDARCASVCPLTTLSMTEAVRMLGPAAARHMQLLGIDANPDATSVADVRAYSAAHQMTRSWDFLTGTSSQLAAAWRGYHVYVAASHANIDHEPAVYLIDEQGRERTLYLTQMAYATVGQQADLIAAGVSRLLPGHPVPHGTVPMTPARATGPGVTVRLPVIGGATHTASVLLGRGHPHVVVFLAGWLNEVSDVPAGLKALAGYQRQALRHGWPTVAAISEPQTETSPAALSQELAQAGGQALGYPVAADTGGQVADGYAVQDLPWIEITTARGRIVFKHDGWLSATALAQAARHAVG
jgi:cytochrome oxidase Cu insertion factor (SCO1/SenC/PrrC family)